MAKEKEELEKAKVLLQKQKEEAERKAKLLEEVWSIYYYFYVLIEVVAVSFQVLSILFIYFVFCTNLNIFIDT